MDGNREERSQTISVFNGPPPNIQVFANPTAEIAAVGTWLRERRHAGIPPQEMGIFVRSTAELERAQAAAQAAQLTFKVLDEQMETTRDGVAVSTMHLAKGLEFRAVAVMACDDAVIPSQTRIETATEDAELEDVYHTERHLLYVACTRARDYLLVTGVNPASEFLDDLQPSQPRR